MSDYGEKKRVADILKQLERSYPNANTALHYKNEFELLVAVILSAQCTDKQVNKVTEKLFKKYRTPEDFAKLSPEELAVEIKGCGLYRSKAFYIVQTARELVNKHHSRVPDNRTELESLPGVGRKTANVVLSVAFGQAAMPVDTHVHRVAGRLGLASGKNPLETEKELIAKIPPPLRKDFHHRLITLGREICTARKPHCSNCPLLSLCPGNKTT
nr:endonuclease III [Desulfolucanica intricata]